MSYTEYQFRWKHIPSNRGGVRTEKFRTYEDFVKALRLWNMQRPLVWKYAELTQTANTEMDVAVTEVFATE